MPNLVVCMHVTANHRRSACGGFESIAQAFTIEFFKCARCVHLNLVLANQRQRTLRHYEDGQPKTALLTTFNGQIVKHKVKVNSTGDAFLSELRRLRLKEGTAVPHPTGGQAAKHRLSAWSCTEGYYSEGCWWSQSWDGHHASGGWWEWHASGGANQRPNASGAWEQRRATNASGGWGDEAWTDTPKPDASGALAAELPHVPAERTPELPPPRAFTNSTPMTTLQWVQTHVLVGDATQKRLADFFNQAECPP